MKCWLVTRGAPQSKKEKPYIAFPLIAIFSFGLIIFDIIIAVLEIVLYKDKSPRLDHECEWESMRLFNPFKNGCFVLEV